MSKIDCVQHSVQEAEDMEYVIGQIALLWRRLLNANTAHLNITGTERRALLCISCKPGLTQIAIAELLEIEPQNLMRTLDKLQGRAWIEKKPDIHDRRAKCLFVTTEGEKIIAELRAIANDLRPKILNSIDEEKAKILNEQLSLIRRKLLDELE